ncbi:hypothetical protein HPB51_027097 [Rhipicephalus microplus]|uniref:Reverse transcriptase domain-containing protein n=1 Tax=Rhipicephalus microplus TaxID=6941 RepID=A0A9J6D131_RHIMP|nr:hypothetical protein HPB51_027097 [Rhipicephalus microplus]
MSALILTTTTSRCPTSGKADVDLFNLECQACCLLCDDSPISGARECPKRYRSPVDTRSRPVSSTRGDACERISTSNNGPAHAQNEAASPEAAQLEGLIVLHPVLNLGPSLGPSLGTNHGSNHGPNLGQIRGLNGLYKKNHPGTWALQLGYTLDEQDIATTDRQVTIRIGNPESQPITMGDFGTHQGAVLSPLFLNITLMRLLEALNEISKVRRAIYTDDVPIWSRSGNLGEIEEAFQQATSIVEKIGRKSGLECFTTK